MAASGQTGRATGIGRSAPEGKLHRRARRDSALHCLLASAMAYGRWLLVIGAWCPGSRCGPVLDHALPTKSRKRRTMRLWSRCLTNAMVYGRWLLVIGAWCYCRFSVAACCGEVHVVRSFTPPGLR
jgi:hypothetical protein